MKIVVKKKSLKEDQTKETRNEPDSHNHKKSD